MLQILHDLVRSRGMHPAFPVAHLGEAISDLKLLFQKYHYDNAIIFGHAKDGYIHFVVSQSFDTESEIIRYDAFITREPMRY